ncbi:MAG: sulfur oxidation c-type cytochrome SoxA [Burkholderiales bacterium]|nr:sulfur oxidation c-type cytochrome SoxA [Burkholderiales bacterium]
MRNSVAVLALAVALCPGLAQAQAGDNTVKKIEEYRQALVDGNPAELWEARGEDLWKRKRGPKQVSLEACDLGLGAGVIKGAYAVLPRYFADADRVMDLESRLVHCMMTLQGMSRADATRRPFGNGTERSDMEALVAFITAESKGVVMNVPQRHAKEREAYALGKQIFFFRGGPHDFSCATCHSEGGKRIRLQDLPNLTETKDAQRAYTSWPAYRVSQGELRSMQWRLFDCFRQQRFPALEFTSEASVALTMFLARNANGAPFAAPAIKR